MFERVAQGLDSPEAAVNWVLQAPFEDLGFARVDHHRAIRDGLPEVILALGKTPSQVVAIAKEVFLMSGRVLVTRVDPTHLAALREAMPDIEYNDHARLAWHDPAPPVAEGHVAVVTAGTGDIPIAEEAALTATMMGARVTRHYDVGVAGIHRLIPEIPSLQAAHALVVIAGMEGALPSVVGGLVSAPVIAVPTSVGYGASFDGLAALLGMLNSCATGVSVVNIDNGFGAGYLAATVNRLACTTPARKFEA